MPKQKRNWLIDAGLFFGFLLTFFLDLTGLGGHQWLGIAVGTLALYHLWVHWDWVINVTRRLFSRTSKQSRLYYLIDGSLLISYAIILISGLIISTWLNLKLTNYIFWKDFHIYSSIIALVNTLVKIGTHWRWIVKTASKYFGLWRQPSPMLAAQPVRSNPHTTSLNRREFLQLMGVVSLTSLFSAANLIKIGTEESSSLLYDQSSFRDLPTGDNQLTKLNTNTDCTVICDQGCTYPGQCRRYIDQDGNGICDLTECSSPEVLSNSSSGDEKMNTQDTSDPLPKSALGSEDGCVVFCSKNCSYPGQCGEYVDQNGNNLCDLGECLASNLVYVPEQTIGGSHGSGRRRRGN